jgi:Holliday junction DNA helicase RuvA
MIAYLEGTLMKRDTDRIVVLVHQIGYEILVPAFVMVSLSEKTEGDTVRLHIYYHQTEHQPKPVLIGFNREAEREFFQLFIMVEAIGPMKAVKALNMPVADIASAIEAKNAAFLKRLSGIGERTAQKVVATLQGKVGKFALIREERRKESAEEAQNGEDLAEQVIAVLTGQLGHKAGEAKVMVDAALKRNPAITTPEALFEEVYRGEALK